MTRSRQANESAGASFMRAFWLAVALLLATRWAQGQSSDDGPRRYHTDFGIPLTEEIDQLFRSKNGAAKLNKILSPSVAPTSEREPADGSRSATRPVGSSFRDRLVREQVLDEDDFTPQPVRKPRESAPVRTYRPAYEETPPVPRTTRRVSPPRELEPTEPSRDVMPAYLEEPARPRRSTVKPTVREEDAPRVHPQPTVREKIERRYTDPRVVRLMEYLTPQSAESLYIEVAQMIDARHIAPSSYSDRIDAAFDHLAVALDSPAYLNAARIKATDETIARLKRSLATMKQQTQVVNAREAISVMRRVQDVVTKMVGGLTGAVGLEFVNAELDTLDQFSMLIPPEKTGGPSVGLKDNFVGIGVEVEGHAQGLKVLKVLPGGPAFQVEMKRGDILTAVDSHPIKGLEMNEAVDYILGQPGTPVKLDLVRGERKGIVTLVRRKIALHSVASRMLSGSDRVGYLKLEQFSESCVKEMDDALMSLHNQGMESLILDLRGNPGGLLTAAIAISDRFLPAGTIVSTKGRTSADNSQEQAQFAKTWKMPLVVLIDRHSASASEILAAAIQENGRGVIVGETSYGKGTVQTLFPLQSAPAGLRLTTAKFYSPDGREMAGVGVIPDVKVDPSMSDDESNDKTLQAGLKLSTDPRTKEMAQQRQQTGATLRTIRVAT